MARFAHDVPRTRGQGLAAVSAALLAVLIILLSSSVLGSEHRRVQSGAVFVAEAVSAQSEPHADNADAAVTTAAVRPHRDVTGDHPAPPVLDPGASRGTAAGPLRPAQPPFSTVGAPASAQPAHRHGVRAPPSLSGF
ncbi:hypothetical protein [Streptomyces lacrimifluminis]|uniref:Uncharacterized protein n=1 Tax=Streptomyces lacrimifluminis TaxID=1500077 RepID=A0A917NYW4_9ACTN|nr:hypothetical protein [Streptomyces lacrimifluminis]GGJ42237.1 hypothetical protein GCM10012282_43720 [Streptomyces lacrimifluminis]